MRKRNRTAFALVMAVVMATTSVVMTTTVSAIDKWDTAVDLLLENAIHPSEIVSGTSSDDFMPLYLMDKNAVVSEVPFTQGRMGSGVALFNMSVFGLNPGSFLPSNATTRSGHFIRGTLQMSASGNPSANANQVYTAGLAALNFGSWQRLVYRSNISLRDGFTSFHGVSHINPNWELRGFIRNDGFAPITTVVWFSCLR